MIFTKDKQNKSFTKVFRIYHISWWLFLVFVDSLRHIDNIFTKTSIEILILYFCGSMAGILLHLFFRKLNYKSFSLFGLVSIIILSSMVAPYFWNINILIVEIILRLIGLKYFNFVSSINFFEFSFFYTVLFITYSGLYFTLKIWLEWIDQRIQTEKAISLEQQSQLQMLRYQLNPHFIFNSLCSLRALVENEKAELMITKLSEFLRYTLDDGKKYEVALSEEIEVTKNYLDIEKVRFGKQLIVNYNIDNSSKDYLVPSFMINPLIENAVKHGFNTSKLPLIIDINTSIVENKTLVIEVINTGQLKNSQSGLYDNNTKTGLTNIKKRLSFLYPNAFNFELFESDNKVHTKITLHYKLRTNNEKKI